MFVLRKLEIEEGKNSLVEAGHTTKLPNAMLFHWQRPDDMVRLEGVEGVKRGYQLCLYDDPYFHRTSEIKEVTLREPNRVVFHTQASLYELSKEDSNE